MRRSASSPGLTGALFREFAFTLAGAVVVSGVIALTLSPMMASKLLKRARSRAAASCASSTAPSTACGSATSAASTARSTTGRSRCSSWSASSPRSASCTSPRRRSWRPRRTRASSSTSSRRRRPANLDYLEQGTARARQGVRDRAGEGARLHHQRLRQQRAPGHRRHPVQAVGASASARRSRSCRACSPRWPASPAPRRSRFALPSLPGSTGGPPVQFVITTTADYPQLAQVLAEVQAEAAEERPLHLHRHAT